jgi:meiotically up-regulated gene 157 (Mug157) protein
MAKGLVLRHFRCILLDPYANAFTYSPSTRTEHAKDLTTMKPGVFERKFELDSLCYSVGLLFGYWSATADATILNDGCRRVLHRIIEIWRLEQNHAQQSGYRFQRHNCPETDTLDNEGKGTPVNDTRLIWSGFRPSDDTCELHYHVPSQAFATVALSQMAELAATAGWEQLLEDANALLSDVRAGLSQHGHVANPVSGEQIFAYEVDGYGNAVLMDDANVPSLLSLPWLGFCAPEDPLYLATRAFVLSTGNPYFLRGEYAEGVGSPHTPPGRVWPMSIIVRALTSLDCMEIHGCLKSLVRLSNGTGLIHESADPDSPAVFSRSWFAWANSMFGELIFWLAEHHPEVLVDFKA